MAYKRYIKKRVNGKLKTFGPYYYESKKENGKVISRYIGTSLPKKKNIFKKISNNQFVLLGVLILLALTFLRFFILIDIAPTGEISLSVGGENIEGEILSGNVVLTMMQGELIPASTSVLINNSGQENWYVLENLLSESPIVGEFFMNGKTLSGSGEGFGIAGEKEIYPEVNFTLKVSGVGAIGIDGEPTEGTVRYLNGTCSYNESFTIKVFPRETAEIFSSDHPVELTQDRRNVVVTTNYSEIENGFGQDYLIDNPVQFSFDLDSLNIIAIEGQLKLSFIYEDEELVSTTKTIGPAIEEPPNITINTTQQSAALGNNVEWNKNIQLDKVGEIIFEIPKEATNIKAYKAGQEITIEIQEQAESKQITIDDDAFEYDLIYETSAPTIAEEESLPGGKKIKIKGALDPNLHYKNVLVYTDISEDLNLRNPEDVKIYWVEQDDYIVPKKIEDTDSNEIYDYVEWVVPQLSNQTFEITIYVINIQSYPTVGGNWVVEFNTTGTANLTVRAVDGTTWSDTTETEDLKFLEIKCGAVVQPYQWINNEIFIEDYNCDNQVGSEISQVLTIGEHHLEFDFGGQKAYANNDASLAYDSCNTADVDPLKFIELVKSGDITGTGTDYLLDHSSNTEMTIHTSGLKEDFTKVKIEGRAVEDLGNGRGWSIGIGTGTVSEHSSCQTNTGWSPSNGYYVCFYGNNGGMQLYRVDSGTETQIDSTTQNILTGVYENYTLEVNSTGVFFFINDVLTLNAADTTYSSGGYITISTGGGGANRGTWYINNVWELIDNSIPTTPTNILCNGNSNCDIAVDAGMILEATGSTDAESDPINYYLEAELDSGTCVDNGACGSCGVQTDCSDCSSAGCAWLTGGGTQDTLIHFAGFESGEQGWVFTYDDSTRISEGTQRPPPSMCDDTSCSDNGGYIAFIRDDSSTSYISRNFDFTDYDSVLLSFWSWEYSWDNINEYVIITCDGNEIWRQTDQDYSEEQWLLFEVEITPADCTFDNFVEIRFDGAPGLSGNQDFWYIDGINLTGTKTFAGDSCSGNLDCSTYSTQLSCEACSQCEWQTSKQWTEVGSHLENSNFFWDTSLLPEQTDVNLRARAIDESGSNSYSDYFTKNPTSPYLEIDHEANNPPTIDSVGPAPSVGPIENNIRPVTFEVLVSDSDGYADINLVTTQFTFLGEPTRTGNCVFENQIDSYTANYSCVVEMQYYDAAGEWQVTAQVFDSQLATDLDNSQTFLYLPLTGLVISSPVTALIWPTLNPGQTNVLAQNHPVIINNTGNYEGQISITSYDLEGETTAGEFIAANNFWVGIETGGAECSSTQLQNSTQVAIIGSSLPRGQNAQEEIYFCIAQVPSVSSQEYSSSASGNSWVVEVI